MTIAVKPAENRSPRASWTKIRYFPPQKCQIGEKSKEAGIAQIVMRWMRTMNMCLVAQSREKSLKNNRYNSHQDMYKTQPIKSIALRRLSPIAMAAACAISHTSCSNDDSHQQWQDRQDRYCAERITKFNYEGHSYLKFTSGKYNSVGITHDENCQCRSLPSIDKNQQSTLDSLCSQTTRQSLISPSKD